MVSAPWLRPTSREGYRTTVSHDDVRHAAAILGYPWLSVDSSLFAEIEDVLKDERMKLAGR